MGNTTFLIALYTSLIVVGLLFFFNQKWIEKNQVSVEKSVRILMLLVVIVRYVTYTVMGKYTWYLSLHICNISAILLVIYLFTYNKKMRGPLFLLSFFATAALIQPHMAFNSDNPLYYAFIIDHVVLFFVPFYFGLVKHFTPRKKEIFQTLGVLIPLMLIGTVLNNLLNENYFFLTVKPLSELIMENMSVFLYIGLYIVVLFIGFSFIRFFVRYLRKRRYISFTRKMS